MLNWSLEDWVLYVRWESPQHVIIFLCELTTNSVNECMLDVFKQCMTILYSKLLILI
jgi:hypothetical protein